MVVEVVVVRKGILKAYFGAAGTEPGPGPRLRSSRYITFWY